jgi:hypothetical protein
MVDRVVDALTDRDGSLSRLEQAVRALAWERASGTLHLDTALADLDALWSTLESASSDPIPRHQARRWLIDGRVDALAVDRGMPCIDPLSGLHTPGYVLGRIRELDRLADDGPAPLVLLSMQWRRPVGPWLCIATVIASAAVLHETVRPEATLAQNGTHGALALVADDLRARVEHVCLARQCRYPPLHEAHARLVVLPDDRDRVPTVLRRLRLSSADTRGPISPDNEDLSGRVD